MEVLAVIPARGGSKGIPKKNIRLMNDKPLIAYAIENALNSDFIDDVVVSTDSTEISYIAEKYGAKTLMRDSKLAGDMVTLDPVIYDATLKMEKLKGCTYDYIITMQPTSPLLKLESLNTAIEQTINKKIDCMISTVNKPHLSWRSEGGKPIPNYVQRLNRQQLPANYLETGAFVISARSIVTETSRISGEISVFPITEREGIDIDTTEDWVICETILKRKRIVFCADGHVQLGMGHVYNCITMAYAMMEHEVLLLIGKNSIEGIKKIKETNLPYRIINDDKEIDQVIEEFKPDIWVNDRLDTTEEYILHLKERVPRVVSIEDLGNGAKYADAVINALYTDDDLKGYNIYNGWKYVCLREEFQLELPGEFSKKVKNVLLMFGGTDPSNYNEMLYNIILKLSSKYSDIKFNFVVGIGYDAEAHGVITDEEKNVFVYSNVQHVTRYMRDADIAITSQGRAIFEMAAMGIPAIVISQNQRETSHSFASMQHGFINLGLGTDIQPEVIENTLDWLINTEPVRRNMHELMMQYPLREGVSRVKNIILNNLCEI